MSELCRSCNERLKVPGALPWFAALFFWANLDLRARDSYCSDCAGGIGFLALLGLTAILVVGFVIAVALS